MKIFLGGTCNGSNWRASLLSKLNKGIKYFDPVVDKWNDEAYQNELRERKICDYCLYVITPKVLGFYSIAEIVDDSHKRPEKTIFTMVGNDAGYKFSDDQLNSLFKVGDMIEKNGAYFFEDIQDCINFLNKRYSKEGSSQSK